MKSLLKINNTIAACCFFTIAIVLQSLITHAQVIDGITYQLVIRDSGNDLIPSSTIGLKISILQGTEGETMAFSETHTTESNENGLITIQIGKGESVDNFSNIDWSAGPYFLKIETDPHGGSSYSISSTSQILSVPYAIYSNTTNNVNYNNVFNVPVVPDDISDLSDLDGLIFNHEYYGLLNLPDIIDSIITYGYSGDYMDFLNKPFIADDLSDITDTLEFLFDRDYNNLLNLPDFVDSISLYRFTGDYNDLVNTPSDGSNIGDLEYWNGEKWMILTAGKNAQPLVFCNGVPQWGPCNNDKSDDPIFILDNTKGTNVVAVYPGGVEITVDNDEKFGKSARGSFAVGGFTTNKEQDIDFLSITSDSVTIYIRDDLDPKSARGSFAVGGFNTQKESGSYFEIYNDTTYANVPLRYEKSIQVGGDLNLEGKIVYRPKAESILVSYDIDLVSYYFEGRLVSDGGEEPSSVGFFFGTTESPERDGTRILGTFLSGDSFYAELDLQDLQFSTTYYVKAFARNNAGSGFGDNMTFETPEPPKYSLFLEINPLETGEHTGEGEYEEGEAVAISVTPNAGYALINWTDDEDAIISETTNFNYVMPPREVTLKANLNQFGAPITSKYYNEDFIDNDEMGWAFLGLERDASITSGELYVENDEIYMNILTPMEATVDDFSFKKVFGSAYFNCAVYGFGRIGFKSILGFFIDDIANEVFIAYNDNITSYVNLEMDTLFKTNIPVEFFDAKLEAAKTGTNELFIRAYINDEEVFAGLLENVSEDIFYGQMAFFIEPYEGIEFFTWTLKQVEIEYNPYHTDIFSYTDDFNNENSPWFRTGTWEFLAESIYIGHNNMVFSHSSEGQGQVELTVLSPLGAVEDFSIEIEGQIFGEHNSDFSVFRLYDYSNYVTLFIDENELFIGYAIDSMEPVIIDFVDITEIEIETIKFTARKSGNNLILLGHINNELLLNGMLSDLPDKPQLSANKLWSGHVGISYSNYDAEFVDIDAILDRVTITYGDGLGTIISGSGVIDVDENYYPTIIIGGQEWMGENLKTTKYNNGFEIPNVEDNEAWSLLDSDAFSWYNNNEADKNIYGALYNWHAVQNGLLCPTGWKVPTVEDWNTLLTFIQSAQNVQPDSVAKYLKSCRQVDSPIGGDCNTEDHPRWNASFENLYYGNDYFGFSALPGGYRGVSNGVFFGRGNNAYWWTSNEDVNNADNFFMNSANNEVFQDNNSKRQGSSIRCIRE